MSPTAVFATPVATTDTQKVVAAVPMKGPALVIGSPATATEGKYQTLITDLDEVSMIRGKATKGRTTDKATCDATSSKFRPERPTAIATTMDGTRPIIRVIIRRRKG